ncbi:MAG: hypothetical protein IKB51_07385 [Clostridia bacterium]|nr:hypothetical protein [Clostridia bacterium]
MEKEQIIKALECCKANSGVACSGCPYMHEELADGESCSERMALDTLALIKELTEENERYKAEQHEHFEKWLKLEKATREHHSELFKEAKIAVKADTVREIFKEIYSSLDYIEEQMEPEEIPECFFSVREDINALKEKFESEGAADEI